MKTPFTQTLIITLLALGFVAHATNSEAGDFESTAKKIESAISLKKYQEGANS